MKILNRSPQKHTLKNAEASALTRPMPLKPPGQMDYAERSGAAFLPTLEGHVAVPFLQAVISGLYAAVAVGAVSFLLANIAGGYVEGFGLWTQLESALVFALTAGFIISWRAWAGNLGDYKDLLWYKEFAEGPEVVPEQRQTYGAEVRINNNWVHSDLPFDRDNPQALVDFAKGVIAGAVTFSEQGAGRYNYTPARFGELRDNFIKGNLAYWKDPKNRRAGVGLLKGGLALLRSVGENPPPPDYEPGSDWGMSPHTVQK